MRDDQWDPGDSPNVASLELPSGSDFLPTPKQPSRKKLGQMRRRYVTIQHSTVVACGHPYDIARPPSTNCFWCWQAFFRTNLEETHKALQTYGSEGMIKVYGEKFVKMFKRFLADELLPEETSEV